jgi:hypothetical protein
MAATEGVLVAPTKAARCAKGADQRTGRPFLFGAFLDLVPAFQMGKLPLVLKYFFAGMGDSGSSSSKEQLSK